MMKKMALMLRYAVVVALLVSGCTGITPVANASSFRDISGHWAESTIYAAVSKGYVDGYEDGTFRPNLPVTRAEFVKLVVSALGIDPVPVDPDKPWYGGYVNAAVNAGIHKWEDFTSGDWNTPLTREEMARLAVRAVGEDTDDPLKWMYLATSKGLIQGTDNTGKLDEKGTTTRAQAVAIIERILTLRAGGELKVDKRAVSRAEVLWHRTNIFTVMSEYFTSIDRWDTDKLVIEPDDGKYRGVLDALIAVDLDDPNDPFLSELPPLDTLYWRTVNEKYHPVTEYKNAYLVLFKNHIDYNLDHTKYVSRVDSIGVSIIANTAERRNMDLEKQAVLYRPATVHANVNTENRVDLPIRIVPKNMKMADVNPYVSIRIYADTYPGYPDYSISIIRDYVDR